MPIHLPPLPRREFLARALAAGAGLALGPKLLAADPSTDEDSWALLGDTHIAADRATVARGVNMMEHFTTVARELMALPARPAGVFVVGDCAFNSGETKDYATFTELLEPIRRAQMPVHLALGNHDHRAHFREVLAGEKGARRPLADKQVALLMMPRANWFVLDSLEKTLAVPGLLGPEQLQWLAGSLDENTDKPALVLVHHNPDRGEEVEGLKDTDALFKVLRPRKQVKALVFGHTHEWSVTPDESGLHLVNLPPVAYVFTEGKPSGWVHATLSENGMRLELRCVDQTHTAHGQISDLKWRT